MNGAPLTFFVGQLGVLRRGDKLLVMDRRTGRSVYVPATSEPLLRLIYSSEARLPSILVEARQQVAAELAAHGINTVTADHFDTLDTVILKLTNACNFQCVYCYDYERDEKVANLSIEMALRAISEALELCRGRLQVIFHGGEPFLVFGTIMRIVLASEQLAAEKGKGILFSGQTNLSLLTDESVRFSIEHDIHWGFSLDGPQEVNDFYRVAKQGDSTHNRFERSLQRYPEFVQKCSALATITIINCDRLLEISRYFFSCGLAGWDWSLFQPIGRGRISKQMHFNVESLIASWSQLFDAVADGEFDGFTVSPVLQYIENFVWGPGHNMCLRRECGAARNLISISANGQIEACDCMDPKGQFSDLGNITSTSLRDALNSPKAQMIRSRDVERTRCCACIWLAVCGGTCIARAPGLHEINDYECQLALNAFDHISQHLAESPRLLQYLASCYD